MRELIYTVTVKIDVTAKSLAYAQQSIYDLLQEVGDKEREDHGIEDYRIVDEVFRTNGRRE